MAFYVGQKVVRISGKEVHPDGYPMPKIGDVYTVRAVEDRRDSSPWREKDELALLLVEFVFGINESTGREYAFRASNFRPIVDRKTDITIFEEIRDGKRRVADPYEQVRA